MPVGLAGVGGTTHLALELFAQSSGAKILHVPYKGAAPVISDVINSQVSAFLGDLPGVIGHIRAGTLKPLAMLASSPNAQLPGGKTMAEQGLAGVEMENWYGVYAPARTPAELVGRLNKAVHAALSNGSIRTKLPPSFRRHPRSWRRRARPMPSGWAPSSRQRASRPSSIAQLFFRLGVPSRPGMADRH